MADEKTAKIGKIEKGSEKGRLEFGEVYHVVVANQVNKNFHPEFIDFRAGQEFYELFAEVEVPTEADEIHLAETANWIFHGYHVKIRESLWKKISKNAEKEKWSTALPKAFRDFLTNDPKVLIWLRSKTYRPERNVSLRAVGQLTALCEQHGALPVFVGEKIVGMPEEAVGLWEFYKDDFFLEAGIAKQLWCLNLLYEKGGALASVGMMSGAMDGLAMICGKKVVFLAKKEDAAPRMAKVSMVVPSLHWVELFYKGNFQQLSDAELEEIRKRVFG